MQAQIIQNKVIHCHQVSARTMKSLKHNEQSKWKPESTQRNIQLWWNTYKDTLQMLLFLDLFKRLNDTRAG